MSEVTLRRLIQCSVALAFASQLLALPAGACSFDRSSGPSKSFYRFWAEVVGEETLPVTTSRGTENIIALRVRVVEGSAHGTSPGAVHLIHRTRLDSTCARIPQSLRLSDYPIGATLQVTGNLLSDVYVYRLEQR